MNLYCIECEETVNAENLDAGNGVIFGHEVFYPEYDELGNPCGANIDFCEMVEGWATVPPPEFDMEEFMETVGEQPIDSDFLAYDYDVETDQIITEIFP